MSIGYNAAIKLGPFEYERLGFVYGETDEEVHTMAVRLANEQGYEHGIINLHQMLLGNSEFTF